MEKFPEITTARLLLNGLHHTDIPLIMEYAANPAVSRTTLNIPHPYTEADAVHWLNMAHRGSKSGDHYIFALRNPEDRQFMGGIGLTLEQRFQRAELGYWLAEPFWGQGYMSEAAGAIIHFGFTELGLRKIYATHIVGNPGSGKVMVNNGMVREGRLRQHIQRDGVFHDVLTYGILRDDPVVAGE